MLVSGRVSTSPLSVDLNSPSFGSMKNSFSVTHLLSEAAIIVPFACNWASRKMMGLPRWEKSKLGGDGTLTFCVGGRKSRNLDITYNDFEGMPVGKQWAHLLLRDLYWYSHCKLDFLWVWIIVWIHPPPNKIKGQLGTPNSVPMAFIVFSTLQGFFSGFPIGVRWDRGTSNYPLNHRENGDDTLTRPHRHTLW